MSLTPREQLFSVLNGEQLEQPPVWLLFPYHATDYYVDVRNHPLYRPIHERSEGQAIILNRRNFDRSPFVEGEPVPERLNSDEDLETAASCKVETDPARITVFLDDMMPQYMQEKKEFPEELGAMHCIPLKLRL